MPIMCATTFKFGFSFAASSVEILLSCAGPRRQAKVSGTGGKRPGTVNHLAAHSEQGYPGNIDSDMIACTACGVWR
jgi:hypothetical protein